MKMKKKFLTIFLLFFIAVALTSSCSPIGSLLVDSGPGAVRDYIKVAPKHYLFILKELFIPEDEMRVTGIFNGKVQDIDINDKKLEFKIIVNPGFSDKVPVTIDREKGFKLEAEGISNIIITYMDMETDYPIQVVKPGTIPPSGGSGIEFIWN